MLTLASLLYFKYLPFLSEQGEEKWVLNSHPAASHWHDLLLPTCSGCACRPQEEGECKRVHFLSHPFQWEDQNSLHQYRLSARVNSQLCRCAQVLRYNDCSFHTSHNPIIRNFPLQILTWEEQVVTLWPVQYHIIKSTLSMFEILNFLCAFLIKHFWNVWILEKKKLFLDIYAALSFLRRHLMDDKL